MGFFAKLMGKEESEQPVKELKACVSGKVIPLEEVNDGVFSNGMLGKGVAIIPGNETVISPCAAEITTLMDGYGYAVGMKLNNGMDLLIHVGIDTVEMNGDGFKSYVKIGDKVKAGQKLLSFDKEKIAAAGYKDDTIVVITNSDEFPDTKFHTGLNAVAGETVIAEV